MKYGHEMHEMLTQIVTEGLIRPSEREPLEELLSELLRNSKVANWFSRDWNVRTEVPILLPGGQENRIDRLLMKDKKAVVLDFKTGVRKKSDEKQVQQYMDVLRQMNYPDVEGYLLYLGENDIVEVKAGKPQFIQKVRNKDQLDLGF
jgi:hypothetical protein